MQILHVACMRAGKFFYKTWKIHGQNFVKISMQHGKFCKNLKEFYKIL